MEKKLFLKWTLVTMFMIFSQKSFGNIITLNINNGNGSSAGTLYTITQNAAVGDVIRFVNNLNYTIYHNDSAGYTAFINGINMSYIPLNLAPGQFYEITLTSTSQTQFMFVHDDFNQHIFYNNQINLNYSVLGINDILKSKDELNIYPNPSNGIFTIQTNAKKNISYSIFSMDNSTLIRQKRAIDNKGERISECIDLSELSAGTYLIQIDKDGQKISKKLIINK